ncbi:hypothetical protein ZWY2020_011070 [Hordeum vulgare]|nr:hypothetical protein ZWY2020_011070 [Hordeum vulgare]
MSGTRGRGRGRATRSPPPHQADSHEHRTSRVDSSEVEATRSPVHEPRVDEPQVDEPSTNETRVPEGSFHVTPEQSRDEGTSQETQWDTWPEPSGHAGSDEELCEGATVYQRGSLGLHLVPATPEQRGWIVAKGVRKPNSILGVLCRQNFAGCEEGYEEDAAKVIETECRRLLQNFRHEARVQAVRDYYATRRIRLNKAKCRDAKIEKEHYMKVPPRWCVDKMDCWEALVDQWCSEKWEASHNNAKERRGKMVGVPHHQGSVNLIQFGENWAHHNKTEAPQMYDLDAMAHTASYKKVKAFSEFDLEYPENFTNISSHDKLVKYRDHGKARKREDFNPSEGPIDPELVMIAGNGRPHGSIAIGDGLIRCPSSLRQIKARQTSSCPEITRCPRPVELAIEAPIQKEREAMQATMVEKDKEIRELEERTTALVEAERARNDASTRAIYELFVLEEGDNRRRKRKIKRKEEEEEEKKKKEREEDKKKEKKEEKEDSSFCFSFSFSSSSPLPSPSPPSPPPPYFTSSSLSLLLRSLDSSKKDLIG